MTQQPGPFLDLITPHLELEEELEDAFREALPSAAFIGGPQIEAFDREFAAYCGTKYSADVANGTDAVRFADGRRRRAGGRGRHRRPHVYCNPSRQSARRALARSSSTSTSGPTA